MTAAIGKFAAKKMLNSQLKKYSHKEPAGQYDPYYEYRRDARGRKKKYKKQIPSYIPEHDAEILASVRKRAYRLDMALFNFMGIRFGWSSVIGLIPELGDVIDLLMALSVYRECNKVQDGLDSKTKSKMKMYILFDFVIGLVPIFGDLLDASVKANSHNVRLLEIALDKKYKPREIEQREERLGRESRDYEPPAPATVYEEMDEDEDELPRHESRRDPPQPSRPEPARTRQETRGGERVERNKRGSWFSRGDSGRDSGRRNDRSHDVEMAQSRNGA